MDEKELMPEVTDENAFVKKETAKKPKRSERKSLLRTAVILYLSLAILALFATAGWFAMNTIVFIENETPGNIQIQVTSGDLKISFNEDNFEYADRITLNNTEEVYYIDISGDGNTLYFPESLDSNDEPYYNDASTFREVTGDGTYYIDMTVYFRTSSAMDVYLASTSEVTGLEGFVNAAGSSAFSRESLYGSIGCDAICGAARVAFLEPDGDGNLTLKSLWIPNDNIALVYNGNTATIYTDNAHRESATRGYHYLYQDNDVMREYTYTADDYAFGRVSVSADNLASPTTMMINQGVPLLTFDETNAVQTKSLVVRIWFEGTDREADKALNGGKVQYLLNFVGIEKGECTTVLTAPDRIISGTAAESEIGIYYNTLRSSLHYFGTQASMNTYADTAVGDGFLLFSQDGIHWSSYTASSGTVLERRETDYDIYVRVAETSTKKAGNIIKVTIPAAEPEEPEENAN